MSLSTAFGVKVARLVEKCKTDHKKIGNTEFEKKELMLEGMKQKDSRVDKGEPAPASVEQKMRNSEGGPHLLAT